MPLNNCKAFLTLTWSEARAPQIDNPAITTINAPTNVALKKIDTKLY